MRRIAVAAALVAALVIPTSTAGAAEHTCRGRVATIVGTNANEVIIGTPGDDVIVGLGGRDQIRAKGGDDLICGGGGNDTIWDGPGNDTVVQDDHAHDVVIAGSGDDEYWDVHTVSYENARRRVKVDLRTFTAVGMGRDELYGVTNVTGSAYDDVLRGDEEANRLIGGGGADLIIGFGGHDELSGNGGDDTLRGKDGDDTIHPGPGDDAVAGGSGWDILSYSGLEGPIDIGALDDRTALVTGALGTDTIEQLLGDELVCPSGDTTVDFPFRAIDCGTGNVHITVHMDAWIETGRGSTTIVPATADPVDVHMVLRGSDTVTFDAGSQGVDAEYFSGPHFISLGRDNDVVIGSDDRDEIYLGDGDDRAFAAGGDDLIDGGTGNDAIAGWLGDDDLIGGPGIDYLDPGHGDDMLTTDRDDVIGYDLPVVSYDFPYTETPISADLAARTITGRGTDVFTTSPFGIIATKFDDTIRGDGHGTWIDGGEGNDLIEALGGDDVVMGGKHNDVIYGGSGDDLIDGGPGGDETRGNSGTDSCYSGIPTGCENELSQPLEWSELIAMMRLRLERLRGQWND